MVFTTLDSLFEKTTARKKRTFFFAEKKTHLPTGRHLQTKKTKKHRFKFLRLKNINFILQAN